MKKSLICAASALLLAGALANLHSGIPVQPSKQYALAFATYVGLPHQDAAAAMLVDSIRAWGGEYRKCPIYVVLVDPASVPGNRVMGKNVERVPLKLEGRILRYPFAAKAYAAAKVEELAAGKFKTLAWFDPETLLLHAPKLMDLSGGVSAAVNPVHLVNGIGLAENEPLDAFWTPIVNRYGLDSQKLFPVESLVDAKTIRTYLNCGIFSVRPDRGLLREWAKTLDEFICDSGFQRTACPDAKHQTFLHQAVFTSILVSKLERQEIRLLPADYGYPLHLQARMPAAKKARTLDDLTTVFHESLWIGNAGWLNDIPPASAPLKKWLIEEHEKYARSVK
jgi:hypothetical protein